MPLHCTSRTPAAPWFRRAWLVPGIAFPLLGSLASPPLLRAELNLTFDTSAVEIRGATSGGEVVLHGVSRWHETYFWRLVPTTEILQADASGAARAELPDGLAQRSVWFAVDTASGDFAIDSPEGFTPEEIGFPEHGLARDRGGAWRRIRSDWARAEVVYVRPGVGAWWLMSQDGAGGDADGLEGGGLSLDLDAARTLWRTEPPPSEIGADDVIFAVNLDSLAFFAARLVAPGSDRQPALETHP